MKKYLLFVTLLMLFLAAPVHAQAASMKLTFTDTSNKETSFKIERALTSTAADMAAIGNAPTSTATPPATVMYTDTGLIDNQSYCYRVSACNADGCSLPTAIVCGKTAGPGIPSAPINLKADPVPATSGQLTPEMQPEASPQAFSEQSIKEQTYDPQYFTDLRARHWKHSDPR
jgi:hypothetical protein